MADWISVDERLPERNVQVLLYSPRWGIFTDDTAVGIADWWEVSHWMPLPPAPVTRLEVE